MLEKNLKKCRKERFQVFFIPKQKEKVQEESVKVKRDVKEEPEVEFLCVLPPFYQDRTLLGDFKVKEEAFGIESILELRPSRRCKPIPDDLRPYLKYHKSEIQKSNFDCNTLTVFHLKR